MNQGSDDCVMIRSKDGLWEDFACTSRLKVTIDNRENSLTKYLSQFVKNLQRDQYLVMTRLAHVTIPLAVTVILALNSVAKLMTCHSVHRQSGNGIPERLLDDSTAQIDFCQRMTSMQLTKKLVVG